MLIKILIGIAILIAVLLIIPIFIKKEYTVQREITIRKPKQEVFNYIKILKNSEHYNKWVMTDPEMKKELRGTDGNVGFVYAWDSQNKQVGKGEQEITNIIEGEKVEYEIRFVKPFEGVSPAYISTEATSPSETKVKWVFHSKMPYPMNILLLFFDFPEMLGKDLETSLNNLKTNLEK